MPFSSYDAATHLIGRANAVLAHVPDAPPAIRDDLCRTGIVMGIAALDTYMHRLIVYRAYDHNTMPGKLAGLDLSFAYALQQADESAAAARAEPKNTRPRVALKRALRDRLLRESYQRFDDVSTALGMAGLSGNWEAIGTAMTPVQTSEQIKKRLGAIATRRNQIAHEGDYERLDRPQQPNTNPITPAEAQADVAYLSDLIDAIHSVAYAA